MRSGKWYFLHFVLLSAAIAGFAGSGCKKEDGTQDNTKVIQTPYSLYFADKLGGLYNTNDGQAYKIIFPYDGVPARSLLTSGNNILWAKYNLHLSADNGLNFNPVNRRVDTLAHWQSLMANGFNMVLLATLDGIAESDDNGESWPRITGPRVLSLARLNNGFMYAVDASGALYEKQRSPDPFGPVSVNTPFPGGTYHLANFNNALIAGDATGANGVWYSNNNAVDWAQYTGLPTNQEIRSMHSPLGQGLLVGLDSAGIYRLVGTNFQPSNNGLKPFTTVYGITSKQDIYKNEVIRQYVYIATSTGLYRSEDLGQNWAMMRTGDYRTIY